MKSAHPVSLWRPSNHYVLRFFFTLWGLDRGGFEPPALRLSGVYSYQLSYLSRGVYFRSIRSIAAFYRKESPLRPSTSERISYPALWTSGAPLGYEMSRNRHLIGSHFSIFLLLLCNLRCTERLVINKVLKHICGKQDRGGTGTP